MHDSNEINNTKNWHPKKIKIGKHTSAICTTPKLVCWFQLVLYFRKGYHHFGIPSFNRDSFFSCFLVVVNIERSPSSILRFTVYWPSTSFGSRVKMVDCAFWPQQVVNRKVLGRDLAKLKV